MKSGRIVRTSLEELNRQPGKTGWSRLDALSDAAIEQAIDEDPDAAPPLDEDWFRTAELVTPPGKQAVSLRVDRDVLDWFKRQGKGYQSRMNAVLRAYMAAKSRSKKAG
jgi:uncharacterized protein (DUF4415 family)